MNILEILKTENVGKIAKSELGEFKIGLLGDLIYDDYIEQKPTLYVIDNTKARVFCIPSDKITIDWELIEPEEKIGWERAETNKCYYYIDAYGEVQYTTDTNRSTDDESYNSANYFTDEPLAKHIALGQNLYREMSRWADEHNDKKIDWKNLDQPKYYIYYNHCGNIEIDFVYYSHDIGKVYFTSKKLAGECLKEFNDKLLKYFTYGI